ncbi:hypothetical protein QN277_007747 [Acacia crassicarpa]|uniref:Protein kinase domain-containing protein n=1 Tax=Acacia crassicarpa TaxID=499986 RepID=A0AAE1IXN9_9FABA|nr:hypothetical protein QN277_007747 [Acacia crassicarpa]
MFWYGRFLLLLIVLKQGNGENQQVPHHQTLPFRLYYNESATLMVEFPSIPALQGLSFHVSQINYESHSLNIVDPEGCLPRLFLQRHLYNSSNIHPLEYHSYGNMAKIVTYFNCSSAWSRNDESNYCPIIAIDSDDSVLSRDLVSCSMISRLPSPIAAYDLQHFTFLTLKWPFQPEVEKHKTSKMLRILSSTTGSIVLVLLLVVCFYICRYFKKKGDDQVRLEKFLADYKAAKPTRFSYADIKRITGRFKDKLGEGAHGTVFKGKLSSEIQVAVKVLNNSNYDGKDFINEMGTMGKIHHINVVRLLGFCADGCHQALVYNFFPNGSLQKFISSPDNKESFMGWSKLQQIALAIAKGIEYLHQGCDYRILHFDINPRNVLLDDNFTPKISDFGLAKLCSKNQSIVSMTAARGTLGYIAPEVFSRNFGNVSYKSDIYSYGMLLLEMVGGRKNVDTNKETFQVLYPEWIHNLIEGRDISIYIEDEVDIRIAKKLAIVGLWCIQWHSINRPSMKTLIQMLEGEVDKLKVPLNPFDFTASTSSSITVPAKHLNLGLDVIHESE